MRFNDVFDTKNIDFKEGDIVIVAFEPERVAIVNKITPRFLKEKEGLLYISHRNNFELFYDRPLEIGDEVDAMIEVTYILDGRGMPCNIVPDPNLGKGFSAYYIKKIEIEKEKELLKDLKDELDEIIIEITIQERKTNFFKNYKNEKK